MVGSIWRFCRIPASIITYYTLQTWLAPLKQVLVDNLATRLLGQAAMQDVFAARELYHHAETIRSVVPIARRYQSPRCYK